ncbi:maspardin-like [Clavelina lepadiformis]|uniref:maspardin-like n=1 Tax=Clavelina lepadiformis TaxID=159417 RepID=UPI0040432840
MSSNLSESEEYRTFRSSIPCKKIFIDEDTSKIWKLYDAGPKTVLTPLVCLPPASGNADIFFRQVVYLSALGYRVIALDYPVYWTVDDFCNGLRKLVDYLNLNQIHVFGCGLGGFLAMKFAERTRTKQYVLSIILCNTFTDTTVFKLQHMSAMMWTLPSFVLKRFILNRFSAGYTDVEQADALDFVVEKLSDLSQKDLASRLKLHYSGEYVRYPQQLQNTPVTLMDVFDDYTYPQGVKEGTYKCFPLSKQALLKSGGHFPYLSRSSEVNLHLRLHLRQFQGAEAAEVCKGVECS